MTEASAKVDETINPDCYQAACPYCKSIRILSTGFLKIRACVNVHVVKRTPKTGDWLDWDYDEEEVQKSIIKANTMYEHDKFICCGCIKEFESPVIISSNKSKGAGDAGNKQRGG